MPGNIRAIYREYGYTHEQIARNVGKNIAKYRDIFMITPEELTDRIDLLTEDIKDLEAGTLDWDEVIYSKIFNALHVMPTILYMPYTEHIDIFDLGTFLQYVCKHKVRAEIISEFVKKLKKTYRCCRLAPIIKNSKIDEYYEECIKLFEHYANDIEEIEAANDCMSMMMEQYLKNMSQIKKKMKLEEESGSNKCRKDLSEK